MKYILAGVFCIASTGGFAADLPLRNMPSVYAPPALPSFSWTGFYVGANAGYAFDARPSYQLSGNNDLTTGAIASGLRPSSFNGHTSGVTGGGQIGYNVDLGHSVLPFGRLVAGVEADAAYTDLVSSGFYGGLPGRVIVEETTVRSRTDFIGTVRGRIGVAFDNLLVFGTGGFAYGGVRDTLNYYTRIGINNFTGSSDTIKTGYAFGGGIEYAIPTSSFINVFHASSVTLKVEYLHYDLGTSTLTANNLVGFNDAYIARLKNDGDLVRGGFNYKLDLGGVSLPVVARY